MYRFVLWPGIQNVNKSLSLISSNSFCRGKPCASKGRRQYGHSMTEMGKASWKLRQNEQNKSVQTEWTHEQRHREGEHLLFLGTLNSLALLPCPVWEDSERQVKEEGRNHTGLRIKHAGFQLNSIHSTDIYGIPTKCQTFSRTWDYYHEQSKFPCLWG